MCELHKREWFFEVINELDVNFRRISALVIVRVGSCVGYEVDARLIRKSTQKNILRDFALCYVFW